MAYVRPSPLAGFRTGAREVSASELLGGETNLRADLDHHEQWKPEKELKPKQKRELARRPAIFKTQLPDDVRAPARTNAALSGTV